MLDYFKVVGSSFFFYNRETESWQTFCMFAMIQFTPADRVLLRCRRSELSWAV